MPPFGLLTKAVRRSGLSTPSGNGIGSTTFAWGSLSGGAALTVCKELQLTMVMRSGITLMNRHIWKSLLSTKNSGTRPLTFIHPIEPHLQLLDSAIAFSQSRPACEEAGHEEPEATD